MIKTNHWFIFLFSLVLACTPKTSSKIEDGASTDRPSTAEQTEDFRSQPPEPGEARKIQLGEAEQFNLPNGLKVIVVENTKIPRVSYQLFVDREPIFEGDKAGYVSIAGQLLSTGTTSKSKAEIDGEVDFIGASLSSNSRGAFGSALKKHSEKILALMADVVLKPSFPKEEFDKIITQTKSGLAAQKEDPNAISNNVSSIVNYGSDHVYGEITTEESVENISLQDCIDYYQKYFKPNISYLVIVGDISLQEAEVQAGTYFGNWKRDGFDDYDFPEVPDLEKTTIAFVDKPGAVQSVINITYPVDLKPGDSDRIAANLMNKILGYGGFSGRLFQNLREDKGYTYGAYSSLDSDEYSGSFSASASVRNEVTDSAITQFLYEMNRIVNEEVPEEELQLAKNLTFGEFARSMESPQTIARFALSTIRFNLPADYYANYLEQVDQITVADIQRVAEKYIRPERANIVVVGNKDEVVDNLREIAEVRYFDPRGNEIEINTAASVNITAEELVANYIDAIGGREKLLGVKDTYLKMEAEIPQMGAMSMEQYSKDNTKFKMSVMAQGMTVQQQIFDGEQLQVSQMGQSQMETNEAAIKQAREQAIAFKELNYSDGTYELNILGSEQQDGRIILKLSVVDGDGNKSTEWYDQETFLKIQEISSQEANGQVMTTTTSFDNYAEIDGLKYLIKLQ